jgi:predicted PurR-regulated permease PerM
MEVNMATLDSRPASTSASTSNSSNPTARYERYVVGAVLLLLLIGCFLVVLPFLTAAVWAVIISLSTRNLFHRIERLVGGRQKTAATLTTLLLALVLLVPIAALAVKVSTGMPAITARVESMLEGGLHAPPSWLASVPLVGKAAVSKWESYAANPDELREELRPYLKPLKDFLVAAVGGVSVGLLQFALALVLAGLLYVQGSRLRALVDRIAFRLAGVTGQRQVAVVRGTVVGVFKGLLGTCAVQAVLAMIGFWIAGVLEAFLLGMGTFFLSVVPGGPVILWLPAALWLNSNGSTGMAIFMGIWGLVVVSGSDNIVRPLLIGRGIDAPLAVVFLGVVGGIFAFGFLGLFIGPVLLVVGYNLFESWMKEDEQAVPAAAVETASP